MLELTAPYNSAVEEKQAKASLQRIYDELRVTRLETATDGELSSAKRKIMVQPSAEVRYYDRRRCKGIFKFGTRKKICNINEK